VSAKLRACNSATQKNAKAGTARLDCSRAQGRRRRSGSTHRTRVHNLDDKSKLFAQPRPSSLGPVQVPVVQTVGKISNTEEHTLQKRLCIVRRPVESKGTERLALISILRLHYRERSALVSRSYSRPTQQPFKNCRKARSVANRNPSAGTLFVRSCRGPASRNSSTSEMTLANTDTDFCQWFTPPVVTPQILAANLTASVVKRFQNQKLTTEYNIHLAESKFVQEQN
jgi:hypothetical protein